MSDITTSPNNSSKVTELHSLEAAQELLRHTQTAEVTAAINSDAIGLPALPYLVVGIGASADGLEAYKELFRAIPTDTGMSFVVVTNVSRSAESHLVDILACNASMPVSVIEDGVTPEPNRVYVLRPDKLVAIAGGRLRTEPCPDCRLIFAMDHFFRSLAEDQKSHAIGVVLSGKDSDGAAGLRMIKSEGGIAIVQTPETARYSEIPYGGLLTDHIDSMLSPIEIATELARLARQAYNPMFGVVEVDPRPWEEKHQLSRILQLLTEVYGVNYGHYEAANIQRRIARRMLVTRMETLDQYIRYLHAYPNELRYLHEEALVGVTRLFRDPNLFSTLKNELITSPARKERTASVSGIQSAWNDIDIQRAADRAIMAQRSPTGVVINDRLEILQSRGHTGPYLAMAPGVSSLNLMKMVQKDLAGQVHTAVRRAIELNLPVHALGNFRTDGVSSDVDIEVLPLHSPSPNPRYYLVLFSALAVEATLAENGNIQPPKPAPEELSRNLVQANSDLVANRFYVQSLIEERDNANWQLISATEEVQSVNEKLRSANEELQTVNEELQQRNDILTEATNDLTNLLTSVNIPVLMLNNQLRIRQFTPLAGRLMNIRVCDIGRLLSEIRPDISVEDLESPLRDVLETLGTREIEICDCEGRRRLLRIRPYRTAENRIEGVVLVFVDIDEFWHVQQKLRQARDFSQAVMEDTHLPLAILRMDFTIRAVNAAFRALAGLPVQELEARSLPDIANLLWKMCSLRPLLESLRSGTNNVSTVEAQFETGSDDKKQVFHVWGRRLQADSEPVFLITMEDVTRAVKAVRSLEQLNRTLEGQVHSTEESLRSTEAQLRALAGSLFTSQEEERRRVARELHDDITQRLAILEIDLEHFKQEPPKDMDAILERVEGLRQRTAQLSEEVRSISHRLHPSILDDLGLPVALNTLVEEFGDRENMPARFVKRNLPEVIPTIIAGVLYRIVQEALRNVSKYAGRTQVKVLLELSGVILRLRISDSGDGFDMREERQGLGLISMAERARTVQGVFSIQSSLGEGTTINVDVPFAQPAAE